MRQTKEKPSSVRRVPYLFVRVDPVVSLGHLERLRLPGRVAGLGASPAARDGIY